MLMKKRQKENVEVSALLVGLTVMLMSLEKIT